jgi:hypothetical protein
VRKAESSARIDSALARCTASSVRSAGSPTSAASSSNAPVNGMRSSWPSRTRAWGNASSLSRRLARTTSTLASALHTTGVPERSASHCARAALSGSSKSSFSRAEESR